LTTGGIRPEKSVYTLDKAKMQRKGVQNKMAKQKKIDLEHMTEKEKMKYEIADELGLLDRVLNDGWRSLTAKETGRIGGLVTRRKRQMAAEGKNENEEK
jgi:hypothetical protein